MGRMEPLASAAFGRGGRGFFVADATCGGRNIFRQRKGLRGARGKLPGRLRRGESVCDTGKERKAFSCPLQGSCFLHKFLLVARGRRFPKGDRKALWSPPQRRNPLGYGEKKGRPVSCLLQEVCFLWEVLPMYTGMGPEGVQGAIGKPFGRLRRGEILWDTGKKGRPVSCLPQGSRFLWEVSPACGWARYFPSLESTQRLPGAAKGCMRRGRPRSPRC